MTASSHSLQGATLPPLSIDRDLERALPCLTVAYHPDFARIGERFIIEGDDEIAVSRLEPNFEQVRGPLARPLGDRRLSRSPVAFCRRGSTLLVVPSKAGLLTVAGESRDKATTVSSDELAAGVVICLSQRVVLVAHLVAVHGRSPALDIVGESDAIELVRRSIAHAAELELAVLITGETGSGKETAARALHRSGAGDGAAFVAVNMAALSTETAAAALFGVAGDPQRPGLIGHAAGGTILLDEIGETPAAVQSMLLRVIESRAYRPSGGASEQPIDARIVAATDRALADAVDRGTFRAALLHRLAAYEIAVPPLRQRREDIARLVVHFAREQLCTLDREVLIADHRSTTKPWFPPSLMERMVAAEWPGNVRELANAVRQLVIAGHKKPVLKAGDRLEARIGSRRTTTSPPPTDSESLLAALREHGWAPGPTAVSLGLPRSTLYDRMARAGIRAARDIPDAELATAFDEHGRDLDAIADALRVSRRAVVLRLRAMGLLER